MRNVQDTVNILKSLGFYVNYKKSILKPTQQIIFLGFPLNSVDMTVALTDDRKASVKADVFDLYKKENDTIEQVARVIGKLVSSFPAFTYGPLLYRRIDIAKINEPKKHKGNYRATMTIDQQMKKDLAWWLDNIDTTYK